MSLPRKSLKKPLRKDMSPWDPPASPGVAKLAAPKAAPASLPRKSAVPPPMPGMSKVPPPMPMAASKPAPAKAAPAKATPPSAASSMPALFAGKYPLADAGHHDEVANNAAIHMLKGGMPKEQAEKQAHDEYVTKLRTDAAHYHSAGMKAATSMGDTESAKRHAGMLQLHRKALGDNPIGALPPRQAGQSVAPKMKFKPHPGDHFAVNDTISSAPHPALDGIK